MTKQATVSAALSRLFSAGVFHELASVGRSPLFARLVEQSELGAIAGSALTVGEVFNEAFERLRKTNLRNEYVYRAALVRNILMGTHSLKTASMLTEFRAGKSKADLIILNGTATVYEIKSERDTLSRLEKQVTDYQKVFAKIYVIAGADHVEGISDLVPDRVGVMCLRRWNRISTIREAIDCPHLVEAAAVLGSLRSNEAASILKALDIKVPDVPNTRLRSALLTEFEALDPTLLHRTMVSVLKKTRDMSSLNDFVGSLPFSLQAAALTYKIKQGQQHNILAAVSSPMDVALTWK
ncbi:sce7726 family protein [Pseudorhodobacter sp.]|uniref:sce7726 family protein n=1 Tax=Pseudorhodobacter sp. TaxID=1934400 RepID=UPI002AFE0B60|nr:sce7726 family protein [Pseudorhodobacter sp.]